MAPVPLPQEQTETYTLSGTGTLLLTLEQRTSRRLSITVEKIFIGPLLSYYNFRIPEPASFWGYLQTVNRDAIIDTFELKYRRESITRWDTYELEPIEQLRCLIKSSTLLIYDNLLPNFIAAGVDPALIGANRAQYLLDNGQPRLIPSNPITGIYYEIEGNHLCQITLIWQGYAAPCADPAGTQTLPTPRSPGGGESGSNAGGGGGTRPSIPPPANRSSDPDSDSPAPPPDSPAGPPSPSPAPSTPPNATKITWQAGLIYGNDCSTILPAPIIHIITGVIPEPSFSVGNVGGTSPDTSCPGPAATNATRGLFLGGSSIGPTAGPAKFIDPGNIISVEYINQ
jgi:hypothetical protein